MPQFLARCIIILIVVFVIFLFRKVLKRLVFILILLGLSFFIYGLINPSWASKLWINVKSLPVQLAVFFGEEEKESIKDENSENIEIEEWEGMKLEDEENIEIEELEGMKLEDEEIISLKLASFITVHRILSQRWVILSSLFVEKVLIITNTGSDVAISSVEKETSSLQSESSSTSSQQTTQQILPSQPPSSNGLTAQEIRETEELFSILLQ